MFKNRNFICLNNERIITDCEYYDEQWYDRQTGEPLNWEQLNEETKNRLNGYYQNMKIELDISNSVSVNNLLK